MPAFRSVRTFALALCAFALVACGDDVTPPPPPGTVLLPPGDWFMHSANSVSLPGAEIARRLVGVTDEQTLLDSARIEVNASGTWQQRYWTRVLHDGELDRAELVIDEGNWTTSGNQNHFVSTLRARTFVIVANSDVRINSSEPMVSFANAPVVAGVYLTIRP